MKACWLAACAAIGICLFTGGCEPSSTGSAGGDAAAIRQEMDQLKSEVARLKARVAGVEARVQAQSRAERSRPNFTAAGRAAATPESNRARIEEARRRHAEKMKGLKAGQAAPADGASKPAGGAAAAPAAN